MKFRPVLLVLLLLGGFYYITTHGWATGHVAPWLQSSSLDADHTHLASFTGPLGDFELKEASAAPAFDS